MVRTQPHYRHEAFVAGLSAAGYQVVSGGLCGPVARDDVLVVWNLMADTAAAVAQVRKQGGAVVVAENGYLGLCPERRQYYALALDGHNGSGAWPVPPVERFWRLGIEPKPWRSQPDGHIVVFGQRGIGATSMASPPNWHIDIAAQLRKLQRREVRISVHPGPPAIDPVVTAKTVAELAGAYCAVTWASARGVRALVEGVPVFYCAPHWIASCGAVHGIGNIEAPCLDDARRAEALHRLSWAQWSVDEIAAGAPFRHLLQREAAVSA